MTIYRNNSQDIITFRANTIIKRDLRRGLLSKFSF